MFMIANRLVIQCFCYQLRPDAASPGKVSSRGENHPAVTSWMDHSVSKQESTKKATLFLCYYAGLATIVRVDT